MSDGDLIPDGHPDPVSYLAERVAEPERRVEQLERAEDGTTDGALDRYDAAVLNKLEEGQYYSLSDLRALYRDAGVRKKATVKRRIEHLTQTYCRRTATQTWVFEGGEK